MKFGICFKLAGKMSGDINETMLIMSSIGWWVFGGRYPCFKNHPD